MSSSPSHLRRHSRSSLTRTGVAILLAVVVMQVCLPASVTQARSPRVLAAVSPSSRSGIPLHSSAPKPTPTPTNSDECRRPPNDYRRRTINGEPVNARTLWMLRLAARIYEGPGDPLRVVQGSYTDELDASFGTHTGGGVVDISIRTKLPPHDVLSLDEAYRIVHVLRLVGFAAWLRLPDDLDPPTTLHIHAVAVGDRELSTAARQQLYGQEGYFRGYDGVPPEHGGFRRDRLDGPVICNWMVEDGVDHD